MDSQFTVVIADDHGLVRRGTAEILEQDLRLKVVGEAGSGSDLLTLVADTRPDVALVDIGMPDMSGIEALRRIRAEWPDTAVVLLTIHDDIEYVWTAIEAGAAGYLTKDVTDEQLTDAVVAVARGGTALTPQLTSGLVDQVREAATRPLATSQTLTPRELEILRHVAEGRSNKAIAAALSMSHRTVEVHLTRIFKKLGAKSRTRAVTLAVRQGLIDIDDD